MEESQDIGNTRHAPGLSSKNRAGTTDPSIENS